MPLVFLNPVAAAAALPAPAVIPNPQQRVKGCDWDYAVEVDLLQQLAGSSAVADAVTLQGNKQNLQVPNLLCLHSGHPASRSECPAC